MSSRSIMNNGKDVPTRSHHNIRLWLLINIYYTFYFVYLYLVCHDRKLRISNCHDRFLRKSKMIITEIEKSYSDVWSFHGSPNFKLFKNLMVSPCHNFLTCKLLVRVSELDTVLILLILYFQTKLIVLLKFHFEFFFSRFYRNIYIKLYFVWTIVLHCK